VYGGAHIEIANCPATIRAAMSLSNAVTIETTGGFI
jgi:hypothetical protein